MALSLNLNDLLNADESTRDEEWEKAFFHAFPQAKLKILNEAPQAGPDSWPYLMVEIDEEGNEPAAQVLNWLSDKGIGLAVNPQKAVPDYVFTYGMIWNFRQRQQFLSPSTEARMGQIKFDKDEKVLAGGPTEEYLPPYVRGVIREFFKQQKLTNMKIAVIGRGGANANGHYDLCFSLEGMGSPAKAEHRGILEAISWFLPAHYSLMLISEKDMPGFQPL
jgi:hypothetical protein